MMGARAFAACQARPSAAAARWLPTALSAATRLRSPSFVGGKPSGCSTHGPSWCVVQAYLVRVRVRVRVRARARVRVRVRVRVTLTRPQLVGRAGVQSPDDLDVVPVAGGDGHVVLGAPG